MKIEQEIYSPKIEHYSSQNSKFKTISKEKLNPDDIEKCDGCYEREGVCFCICCEKIFCALCEEQIHIVPSNRQHER